MFLWLLSAACYGQALPGPGMLATQVLSQHTQLWSTFHRPWTQILAQMEGVELRALSSPTHLLQPSAVADIEVTDVTLPDEILSGCGDASVPVTITITNVGSTTATGVVGSFSVDGAIPTFVEPTGLVIPPTASFDYTFTMATADLSAAGPHTVVGIATTIADASNQNDSASISVDIDPVLSVPLAQETLDGYTGADLQTTTTNGWFEASGQNFPLAPDPGADWGDSDFGNDDTHPNGNSISVNLWNAGTEVWIVSPKFVPDANTGLRFDLALTLFNDTLASTLGVDDSLNILVSSDCGFSWQLVSSYNASSTLSPTGRTETVFLGGLAGQEIQVAFFATEGPTGGPANGPNDNDLFLDNIEITNSLSSDIAVSGVELSSDALVGCATSLEPVTLQISNTGTSVVSGIEATFSIDGQAPTFTETVPGSIPAGGSASYTFNATADLSSPGPHTVTGIATFPGDTDASNDSATVSITTNDILFAPLPLVDFSSYTGGNLPAISGGWQEGSGRALPVNIGNTFDWGAQDFGNVSGGPNGTSISVNLWNTGTDVWIISPRFVAAANTELSFDVALTLFGGTGATQLGDDDSLKVLVSTDCGFSWSTLSVFDSAKTISPTGQKERISLGSFAAQAIQVAFFATEGSVGGTDNDLFIDNILIDNIADSDIEATQTIVSDNASAGCGSANEAVTIEVTNVGLDPVSGISAFFIVDGGAPSALENIPGTLAAGASQQYTFNATADVSSIGPHTITSIIQVGADPNPSNDSASVSITTNPVLDPTLPTVDFVGYDGSNLQSITNGWFEAEGTNYPLTPDPGSAWTDDDFANDDMSVNGVSARINLFTLGKEDWIISPKFNVSTNTELTYDLALTAFSGTGADTLGSDDSLKVMISTDCGLSWTALQVFTKDDQISNTGQAEVVPLGSFDGSEAQIGFFATEGTFNDPGDINVYLDNISIRNVVAEDVAVTSTSISALGVVGCGSANEPVTIEVTNFGTNPASGITATFSVDGVAPTFTESVPGTLQPGATVSYTFTETADISGIGAHTITGIATIAGDLAVSNDSLTLDVNTIDGLALPLPEVDFAGYTGTNLPDIADGWYEAEGTSFPLLPDPATDWVRDDFGNDDTSPNDTSARVNLFTDDTRSWLVSPKIDASATTILSFDIAVTSFFGTGTEPFGVDDSLNVLVSTDCGFSWTVVESYNQSTPTISTTGQREIILLGSFAGQEIIVAFFGTDGTIDDGEDLNVYIDNILLEDGASDDVAATGISVSDGAIAGCGSASEVVTIEVSNQGAGPISGVTATFSVDGVAPTFTETIPGSIPAGASVSYMFNATADVSAVGPHTITAIVNAITDLNAANDSVSINITTQPVVAPGLLAEDFDGYDGENLQAISMGWYEASGLSFPLIPNPPTAWVDEDFGDDATNPNGTAARINLFNVGNNDWLVSPKFVPTASNGLSFDLALTEFFSGGATTLGSDDSLNVMVSNDCGLSWMMLASYNTNTAISPTGQNERVLLGGFAGQEIQVAFFATEGLTDDPVDNNVYVDNIQIVDLPANELALVDLGEIQDGREATSSALSTDTVVITLRNLGTMTASNIPVSYSLNGNLVMETVPGPLTAGSTITYRFDSLLDLSAPGAYELVVFVSAAGDTLSANDTLATAFRHVPNEPLTLPYLETFEDTPAFVVLGSQLALPTLDRFDFEAEDNSGQVQTGAFFINGEQSITIDRNGFFFSNTTNYLINTLNLSGFDQMDTLLLSFVVNSHGGAADTNDRVWVRGADTLPWIEVFDLTTLVPGSPVEVDDINLTTILGGAGQTFSSSTQIRFGQEDLDEAFFVDAFAGFTIDDIGVRQRFGDDVGVVAQFAPPSFTCGDSMTFGELIVSNFGSKEQDTIPIGVEVISSSGTEVLNDTLFTVIALDESDTLTFGPFNTYSGGSFTFIAYTLLGSDQEAGNDTLETVVEFFTSGEASYAGNTPACPGDSVQMFMFPEPGVLFGWYDSDTSTTPLATGNNHKVGPIAQADTFYVGNVIGEFNVGKVDSAGSGDNFTAVDGQALTATVFSIIQVDSMTVYPNSSGEVVVSFVTTDGSTVISSGPIQVDPGSANSAVRIPVGLVVPAGDYFVTATGTTTGGLFRNDDGATYPYEVPGFLSITGNTFDPNYYYFFYDWKVSTVNCARPRTQIIIEPEPLPVAGFIADTSVGDLLVAVTPTSVDADSTVFFWGDGTSGQDTVHMYADTGSYVIQAVAYGLCVNDTVFETVFASCQFAQAGFTATSTGDLLVEVSSSASNADSVIYIWGDGTRSSALTHMYPDTGTYIIEQVAYGLCGNDTTMQMVSVSCTFASGSFIFDLDVSGVLVAFTGDIDNADSVRYDFGGLGTSTDRNPVFNFQSSGNYPVTLTVFNVCGSTSFTDTLYLILTDIDQWLAPGSLKLFPNPADTYVNVSFEVLRPADLRVEWVDARGRMVHEQAIEAFSGTYEDRVRVDNYAEGVYLVKIHLDDQMIIRKVQIK